MSRACDIFIKKSITYHQSRNRKSNVVKHNLMLVSSNCFVNNSSSFFTLISLLFRNGDLTKEGESNRISHILSGPWSNGRTMLSHGINGGSIPLGSINPESVFFSFRQIHVSVNSFFFAMLIRMLQHFKNAPDSTALLFSVYDTEKSKPFQEPL